MTLIGHEHTFDRRVHFDERSRQWDVRPLNLMAGQPRSYTWSCNVVLDQGTEGACVGFGWAHEKAARPKADTSITDAIARHTYHLAQKHDRIMGNVWDEGASVLAGAKAAMEQGWIGQYRWAFTTDDAVNAISRHGPAVIGINWRSGMDGADNEGIIHNQGPIRGGHCVIVRSVDLRRGLVLIHNSWGHTWSSTPHGDGTAWLPIEDLDAALHDDGECCIPLKRT